jgi:cytochrome c oxidase assembly protein subunit 15
MNRLAPSPSDPGDSAPSVPGFLRLWAWLTVGATGCLLALGQLVTSFQAGMADPIWPTEPWYLLLIDWQEPSPGYLIEHSHRIAGFLVGGLTAVLALGLWWTQPQRFLRGVGLAALLLLLAAYGQFHGALMAQRHVTPEAVQWPRSATAGLLLAGLVSLALGLWDVGRGQRGAAVRLLGTVALMAVMIQGLLGGFRVLWDALAGTNLAAIHGVFAQCVLGLLLSVALLAGPAPSHRLLSENLGFFRRSAVLLTVLVFVQIALGAWLRHHVNPLAQRLHVLTAFAVLGGWVWLGTRLRAVREAWNGVKYLTISAGLVLAVQVYLGVEAWLVRYGAGVPPELAPITLASAAWRTGHALVGSLLWVVTLALALHWVRCTDRPAAEGVAQRISPEGMASPESLESPSSPAGASRPSPELRRSLSVAVPAAGEKE